jgi:ParB family transcriptional regulator, chromosome partitioning protein
MVKRRPKVNLSQPIQPRTGDLEKLFAATEDVEQAAGLQLLAVRVDAIQPDPDQPRSTFPAESLQELSASIVQDGVIQPIEVTEVRPNLYRIVHGERRWRAAMLAGLDTIPAVVRRRDYDSITRFVRQLVENIQREDLNDVDRAAGLLRLRDLMQDELDSAGADQIPSEEPWGSKISWAKVGKRLGYSRQRIHQLIKLLELPDEIKDAVRDGSISERDTRIYQGLKASQQRALHRARMAGDLADKEMREVARLLRDVPDLTVHQAMRLLREQVESDSEPIFDPSIKSETAVSPTLNPADQTAAPASLRGGESWTESSVTPPRQGGPSSVERLDWVRGHLARVQRQGLSEAERREALRLLGLIQQDVASLLQALGGE